MVHIQTLLLFNSPSAKRTKELFVWLGDHWPNKKRKRKTKTVNFHSLCFNFDNGLSRLCHFDQLHHLYANQLQKLPLGHQPFGCRGLGTRAPAFPVFICLSLKNRIHTFLFALNCILCACENKGIHSHWIAWVPVNVRVLHGFHSKH